MTMPQLPKNSSRQLYTAFKKGWIGFAGMGLALVANACVGNSGGTDTGRDTGAAQRPPGAPSTSNLTEVATVSAAEVTLTFYSSLVDGKSVIGMRERGSAFATSSPVAELVAQNLTSQEIYLALAPKGANAPQALVEAQVDEAAALDRSPELRQVTIDTAAFVEKDLSACEQKLFSDIPAPNGGHWVPGPSSPFGPSYLDHGDPNAWASETVGPTAGYVLVGACNESDVDVTLFGWANGQWPGANNPVTSWQADMGAYQYYNWYWLYYWNTSGCGSFGCTYGATYTQSAYSYGGVYDIVTANDEGFTQ